MKIYFNIENRNIVSLSKKWHEVWPEPALKPIIICMNLSSTRNLVLTFGGEVVVLGDICIFLCYILKKMF